MSPYIGSVCIIYDAGDGILSNEIEQSASMVEQVVENTQSRVEKIDISKINWDNPPEKEIKTIEYSKGMVFVCKANGLGDLSREMNKVLNYLEDNMFRGLGRPKIPVFAITLRFVSDAAVGGGGPEHSSMGPTMFNDWCIRNNLSLRQEISSYLGNTGLLKRGWSETCFWGGDYMGLLTS